jgi:hypothetical protein
MIVIGCPVPSTASPPTPVFRKSAVLEPVAGTIKVRESYRLGFHIVRRPQRVKPGTEIDATRGVARLVVAGPSPHERDVARVSQGRVIFRSQFFSPLWVKGRAVTHLDRPALDARPCTATAGYHTLRRLRITTRGSFVVDSGYGTESYGRSASWDIVERCGEALLVRRAGFVKPLFWLIDSHGWSLLPELGPSSRTEAHMSCRSDAHPDVLQACQVVYVARHSDWADAAVAYAAVFVLTNRSEIRACTTAAPDEAGCRTLTLRHVEGGAPEVKWATFGCALTRRETYGFRAALDGRDITTTMPVTTSRVLAGIPWPDAC